jgi:tRNA 2-thiouridine synthesizing protein A
VLKLRKILLDLPPETVVFVDITDKNAVKDIPLFCAESGHVFLGAEETACGWRLTVRASSARATK